MGFNDRCPTVSSSMKREGIDLTLGLKWETKVILDEVHFPIFGTCLVLYLIDVNNLQALSILFQNQNSS